MNTKEILMIWDALTKTERTKQINHEWEDFYFGPFIKRRVNKDDIHKMDVMTKDGTIFIGCYPTEVVEKEED